MLDPSIPTPVPPLDWHPPRPYWTAGVPLEDGDLVMFEGQLHRIGVASESRKIRDMEEQMSVVEQMDADFGPQPHWFPQLVGIAAENLKANPVSRFACECWSCMNGWDCGYVE